MYISITFSLKVFVQYSQVTADKKRESDWLRYKENNKLNKVLQKHESPFFPPFFYKVGQG